MFEYFESTTNFSLRCTQGATDVMYFASHNTNTQLRVFSWPETTNNVTETDVDVGFSQGGGTYSAPGPSGVIGLVVVTPVLPEAG